jgi:phenylalanyl-tRNA synthetase beta chain
MPAAPAIPAEPLPIGPADQNAIEEGGLFSLTALSGLRVGPSPRWLQTRLERAGLRPINNVVDITNLVMLELGQPLHAFDRDRLAALSAGHADPQAIGLRPAHAGEDFVALDGSSQSLDADALVVTYAGMPVALAGVMGGANTAVQDTTTSIWLEAAMFAQQTVRRSARSVGLRTDASSRFEKGLPREMTLLAADRAVALFQEICGAQLEGRWLHQRIEPSRPALELSRDAIHNLLGPVDLGDAYGDLPDADIEQILTSLGCVLHGHTDELAVLLHAHRGRLAGGAHDADAVGALGDVPVDQALERVEVDATVVGHRRDERHDAACDGIHGPVPLAASRAALRALEESDGF